MTSSISIPQHLEFKHKILQAWQQQQFHRLVLSLYCGELVDLKKIVLRPVLLKQQLCLQAVYHYKTKDITKNYTFDEFLALLDEWLQQFQQLNFWNLAEEWQLRYKKQQWKLVMQKTLLDVNVQSSAHSPTLAAQQHNRQKQRWIEQQRPFLHYLGVTDAQATVIPNMARKWKQINKFVEIFAGAIKSAKLEQQAEIHVVDFGSGKGYLTCAVYDYLQQQFERTHQAQPYVTGVELREDLVHFCQHVAEQSHYHHLKFFQGDVQHYQPKQTDVMIALHACDTATDFAIYTGIRLEAKVIMCAPCCHKELRPQLKAPRIVKPMLDFGVHAGQQAEMITDGLRALLLQACGYESKILEFVSLEHTSKNKMILAIKRQAIRPKDDDIWAEIEALKQFYGIQQQTLQNLILAYQQ